MLILGNSHVSVFEDGIDGHGEPIQVRWLGALRIRHFLDGHPAGKAALDCLEAEKGWTFLFAGLHDMQDILLSPSGLQKETLDRIVAQYDQVFRILGKQKRFGWLVGPMLIPSSDGSIDPIALEMERTFRQKLAAKCTDLGIAIIDPMSSHRDDSGRIDKSILQEDGFHPHHDFAPRFLDAMGSLAGCKIKAKIRQNNRTFAKQTEVGSLASLLVGQLGLQQASGPSAELLTAELLRVAASRIEHRGLRIPIDTTTDLVGTGLLDSLDLVELYSAAHIFLDRRMTFDFDLRTTPSIASLARRLLAKADTLPCVEDFVVSLEEPHHLPATIAAEQRIARGGANLLAKIETIESETLPNNHPYGIVDHWKSLLTPTASEAIRFSLRSGACAFPIASDRIRSRLEMILSQNTPCDKRHANLLAIHALLPAWSTLARSAYCDLVLTNIAPWIEADPDNVDLLLVKARAFLTCQKLAQADETVQRIESIWPLSAEAELIKSEILGQMGQIKESFEHLKEAMHRDPHVEGTAEAAVSLEKEIQRLRSGEIVATERIESMDAPTKPPTTPTVSAIISVYKAERFLRGCLDDLIAQTLWTKGELEIVIIDSASPENESLIAAEYTRRWGDRIRYLRTPDRESLYAAWNRGIAMATGRYLTNANADDRHRPDALEVLARELDADATVDLVYSDCAVTSVANDTWQAATKSDVYRYPPFRPSDALLFFQFGINPLWRKSIHSKIGVFDPSYKAAGDWDFNIRFNAAGLRARKVDEILGLYYWSDSTISASGSTMIEENNRIRSTYRSGESILNLLEQDKGHELSTSQLVEALNGFAGRARFYRAGWSRGPECDAAFSSLLTDLAANQTRFAARASRLTHVAGRATDPDTSVIHLAAKRTKRKAAAGIQLFRSPEASLRVLSMGSLDSAGAGGAAIRLMDGLRANGIDAVYLTLQRTTNSPYVFELSAPDGGPTFPAAMAAAEAPLRAIDGFAPPTIFSTSRSPISFKELQPLVDQADIIHIHWSDGLINYAEATKVLAGKPVFVTMHDTWAYTGGCHCAFDCEQFRADCASCPQVPVQARNWPRVSLDEKRAFYQAVSPTFIASSSDSARLASSSAAVDGLPVHQIPLPIDLETFQPSNQTQARKRLGLPQNGQVIAFGATDIHRTEKGFPYLLQALRELSGRLDQKPTVCVFGNRQPLTIPDFPYPLHQIGFVTDEGIMREIYSASDVVIFPSLQESFGLTVVESLACGTPVVGFPAGCMPDFIRDGKNGFIARMRDASDLAQKIESMLQAMATDSVTIRRECRETAQARFEKNLISQEHIQLYRKIMETMDAEDTTTLSKSLTDFALEIQVNALLAEADQALSSGNKTTAISKMLQAETLVPDSIEIVNGLAWLQADSGNLSAAHALYLKATLLRPADPATHANLAGILIRRDQPERAESPLRKMLELSPNDPEATLALARVLVKTGRKDEALPLYAKLAQTHPTHPGVSEALLAAGSPQDGITVIVYGRNDAHGQNLQKRAVTSLNALAEQLEPERDEILFTDCNSPDDVPTFPESVRDLLSPRATSLLRVLRLRPQQFANVTQGTSAPVLEALSRNIAVRRAVTSRRWVLSTNTDVVLVSKSGKRLTEIVFELEDGLYGLPRFDIPQSLWEELDRLDGNATMATLASWADEFGLRTAVQHPCDFVGWDNPGDFQLMPLHCLLDMGGFDESMCAGPYHVDSNIARRLSFALGPVRPLEKSLELFHLDHSRQSNLRLKTDAVRGNDWNAKVADLTTSDIIANTPTWGAATETVEEIRLDKSHRVSDTLRSLVSRDSSVLTIPPTNGRADFGTNVPLARLLPFLADHLSEIPGSSTVAVVGTNSDIVSAIAQIRRGFSHTGTILCHGMDAPREAVASGLAAIARDADIVIFDPGTRSGPQAPEPLAKAMAEIAFAHSSLPQTKRAKVMILMPHASWAGAFASGLFDLNHTPTDTWIFHGVAKDRERIDTSILPPLTSTSPARTVAIDARTLFRRDSVDRGIGQYTLHHLATAAKIRPEWIFRLLTDSREGASRIEMLLSLPNVKLGDWSAEGVKGADLYHVPDPMGRLYLGEDPFAFALSNRTTSVFYDVIPRRVYWENTPQPLRDLDEQSLRAVADRATRVLCISEHTKRDFLQESRRNPSSVDVIMAGRNSGPQRARTGDIHDLRTRLGIQDHFFLHVGSIDFHKNIQTSLQAFQLARLERPCSLVIVGRKLDSHAAVEEAVRKANIPDVIFTDFIEPGDLDTLYKAATGLLFLSRYEGFGFPVLEAMAQGCPVIASHATSIPEVAGNAALSHSPDDVQGIATDMLRLIGDSNLRQDLSQRGEAQAKLFRWEDVAQKTLRVWDDLLDAMPSGAGPKRPKAKIQWISPIWDPSGYADESRAFIKHLASTDLGVKTQSWGRHSESFRKSASGKDRQILDRAATTELEPGSAVVMDIPASAMGRVEGAGYHVGRTTFETDGLPPEWVPRCNSMDEIWVPCAFNLETFRKAGVTKPILVVPEGVDTDKFRPRLEPYPLPGPKRETTFLSIFEWTHRKGPDVLLVAWAKAFSATDDVRLVLRCYPPNQIEGDPIEWIEQHITATLAEAGVRRQDCAPIVVLAKQVPDSEMPRLYAAADVYVAPSRGEGWGRPHMEAMSCGIAVIATRWSGNLDFQNDDNSWLIDIDGLEEINAREEFPFYRGQHWAAPSTPHLIKLLRRAAADQQARQKIGSQARQDMVNRWDWSKIAPLAELRLREISRGIPARESALSKTPKSVADKSPAWPRLPSVRWTGPVFNFSGYARLARETLRGLMDAKLLVTCDPQLNDKEFIASLSGKPDEIDRWKDLLSRSPESGTLLICDIPRDTKGGNILDALTRANPGNHRRICWTMFETDRLPEGWASALNTMDEIWVPSEFNRRTFANHGVIASKLYVVPGCLDACPYQSATPRSIPGTGYTFLSVFQWIERKGYDVLLKAWANAFGPRDNVRLVLRCHPFGDAVPVREQLERFLADNNLRRQDLAPIHLIEEFIPDNQMPGLFAASDCFVLPSRGEGWGLPYLEAMASGKPVIATRWSAQTDFLTNDNSWLLSPREPIAVSESACQEVAFTTPEHRWANPDPDELAAQLRYAFEHPEEGKSKGRIGAQDARTKWTPGHTAKIIASRLQVQVQQQAPTRPSKETARLEHVSVGHLSNSLEKVAAGLKQSLRTGTTSNSANRAPAPAQRLSIRWEGSQFIHHSLAHVNRELCLGLRSNGHELSLVPFEADQFDPSTDKRLAPLSKLVNVKLSGPCDVHVRHQWPPNLVAPSEGRWVVVQPWEFGSPPAEWIPVFSKQIDELWAYTNHVRDMYLEAGVPPEIVKVVPLGVDCDNFRPGVTPFSLRTRKNFKFLYVGGTIARKGFDVLLNAWKEAFGPNDDICLVVKDMGGGSFYKGQTAANWIAEMQASGKFAEIEYLDQDLQPAQIPGLYAACDVLVHPYRGEGFGLPIAEAMACGLPCVITRGGAADDFCTEAESWGVQARRVPVPGGKVGDFKTVSEPWWLEPSVPDLVAKLRTAYADADARASKSKAARERILASFTWEHATRIAQERLIELASRPSRRQTALKATRSSLSKFTSIPDHPQAALPDQTVTFESKTIHASTNPDDDLDLLNRLIFRAEASAARGELLDADHLTEEAVEKFPNQYLAWLARAMVLRGLGKFRKASDAIDKSLRVIESPDALLESVQIHVLAGELGPARKAEKALKDRHGKWLKETREAFRSRGQAWPIDALKAGGHAPKTVAPVRKGKR